MKNSFDRFLGNAPNAPKIVTLDTAHLNKYAKRVGKYGYEQAGLALHKQTTKFRLLFVNKDGDMLSLTGSLWEGQYKIKRLTKEERESEEQLLAFRKLADYAKSTEDAWHKAAKRSIEDIWKDD